MSDAPLARDEPAAFRAANAWLREVIEAKEAEVAVCRGAGQAGTKVAAEEVRAQARPAQGQPGAAKHGIGMLDALTRSKQNTLDTRNRMTARQATYPVTSPVGSARAMPGTEIYGRIPGPGTSCWTVIAFPRGPAWVGTSQAMNW